MKKLLIILSMALGLVVAESRQNTAFAVPGAAGFPDVVDGDKLRFGNMVVELFGIRAPRPGMICRAGSVEFKCGAAAAQALDRIIENYAIKCQQVSNTQLFPMLTDVTETNEVWVGRLRQTGENRCSLWVALDNMRKGSALNAVQIAELLVEEGVL